MQKMAESNEIIVVGASSGIAQETIKKYVSDPAVTRVYAISRSFSQVDMNSALYDKKVMRFESDYQTDSVNNIIEQISLLNGVITKMFICNGLLHSSNIKPEKKLSDFDIDSFNKVLQVNTLIPFTWVSKLSILSCSSDLVVTIFSARVGSIDDNRLGGWYTYRTSKAALNMMIKTAAIELRRKHKNWQFVLFHPGTTDTALSKPFQQNVAEGKLFQPNFVASQLVNILDTLDISLGIHYLDWQGKTIQW